ncbi:DUF3152 domain-containing protein [Micromonospora rifamycinica]|uniref:DUF3152 domain-containing protein n=1 Tax=Micromonospora rifamycinica TaxID=291594 RepID=A0A1C5K6T6_9ACTN|nr:Protein of unknown function [Micromonospora rifamycinica]
MSTPTDSAGHPEAPATERPDPWHGGPDADPWHGGPCAHLEAGPCADPWHRDPCADREVGPWRADPQAGPGCAGPRRAAARHGNPYRRRRLRRRRRTVLLGLALVGLGVGGFVTLQPDDRPEDPARVAGRLADGAGGGRLAGGVAAEPTGDRYPRSGPGRFTAADGRSEVAGFDGPLYRYRVEVEQGSGQDVAGFAAAVDATLGDPNSWIRSGELRFQRVPEAVAADFTVYLATPATSERMCAEGGLDTEGYTSCRLPGRVVINLARWMDAVPDYGAPLAVYRTYVVNHEVGHELGEEHQACPGPGEPAPVMQQQTYGLDGCVANAWPYVDGSRYSGDLVPGS